MRWGLAETCHLLFLLLSNLGTFSCVLPGCWERRGWAKGACVCRLAGVQRVDEGGWNTVQGAKNSRVLDPTKFLKITKVGAGTRLVQSNRNAEVFPYGVCLSRKDRYGVYRSKLGFEDILNPQS